MAQPIIPSPFQSIIHPPGSVAPSAPAALPKINFRTGAGETYNGGANNSPAFQAGQQHGRQLAVQHAAQKPPASPSKPPPTRRSAPTSQPAQQSGAVTLNQILAAARASASQDINAQVNPLLQQQALARTTAQGQAQAYQAAAQAAADYLKGIGDNTSASYQNAAKTIAGFAQGYSGQLGTDATNAAAAVQAQLAGLGAPADSLKTSTGQTSQPGALQNVAYGLGGAIPANLLVTSGEAAAAAQRQLPATAIGQGAQQAQSAISAGETAANNLIPQIEQIKAGQPKLVQQYLTSIQNQILQQQLGQSLIGSRAASTKISAYNAQTSRLRAQQSNAIAQSKLTLAQWKAAHPNASAGSKPSSSITGKINDGFLHNADGTQSLVNGKPVPVPKTTPGGSATPAKQTAESFGAARTYHATWYKTDTSGKRIPQSPLRWSQYINLGLSKGIPVPILVKQGRRIYTPAEIRTDAQPPWTPGTH